MEGEEVVERPAVLFEDDSIYIGTWSVDRMHKEGNGIFIIYDGVAYSGSWHNSLAHGYGVLLYPNGSSVEGDWYNGVSHGKVIEKDINGTIFEGGYFAGRKHGPSVLKTPKES